MGETILFCFVFLSQVLLISWFYPRRVISNSRYVLQNFPPSTHPKLYPYPPEYFERWHRKIARFNLVMFVAGLLIIGLILGTFVGEWDGGIFASSRKKDWVEFIVVPFFLVQFVAGLMYINSSSCKILQAMAKAPAPRVRTTELRRRRIVDFVSPILLVVVALTNVAFIAFVLYDYRRFELPWFKAAGVIASVAFALLVFSVSVGIALRAPKPDPYQAHQDRSNMIRRVVKQALAFCIAYPVLLTVWLTIKIFDPDLLEPVIASLYCQGIALALLWPSYSYRVDKVDFDVYRQDAQDATPDASARIGSP
jgi:MFS family permease